MQENKHIDIEKKDDYLSEVALLKKEYKSYKEKLAWVDDNFEEGYLEEKMEHYATKIRALNKKIASIKSEETNA